MAKHYSQEAMASVCALLREGDKLVVTAQDKVFSDDWERRRWVGIVDDVENGTAFVIWESLEQNGDPESHAFPDRDFNAYRYESVVVNRAGELLDVPPADVAAPIFSPARARAKRATAPPVAPPPVLPQRANLPGLAQEGAAWGQETIKELMSAAIESGIQAGLRARPHQDPTEDDDERQLNPVGTLELVRRAKVYATTEHRELSAHTAVLMSTQAFEAAMRAWRTEIRTATPSHLPLRDEAEIDRIMAVAPVLHVSAVSAVEDRVEEELARRVFRALQVELNALVFAMFRRKCGSKAGDAIKLFEKTLRADRSKEARQAKFITDVHLLMLTAIDTFRSTSTYTGSRDFRSGGSSGARPREDSTTNRASSRQQAPRPGSTH
jgi:uncharacterized protein YoaH (UPF0181 family)